MPRSQPDQQKRKIGLLPPTEEEAELRADSTPADEAKLFATGLSAEELAIRGANDEYERGKAFKNSFESVAIWSMRFIAVGIVLITTVWLWHLLTPTCWHWLSEDGLSKLQNIFTGGILVTALGDHLRRRIN